jgi:hypothetical protein
MLRSTLRLTLLTGTLLVLTLGMMPSPAGAAASPAVQHFRYSIDSAPEYSDIPRSASRHGFVVLNFYETAKLNALKRANPNIKVLLYKELGAMSSYGTTPPFSSGVGYAEADIAHPDWFLLNTSGKRFTFGSYSWLWAADIGNVGYQNAWAEKVLQELNSDIWDGVFMDDVNYSIKYHANPSSVAKYPTDAQYGAAMRSMVANVGPKIRAEGKLAIANMQWAEFPTATNDWLQFLDGAMDEVFIKWGTTYTGIDSISVEPGRWTTQLRNVKEAESRGKITLAVTQTPNGDSATARYGYATALLAGQGHTYFVQAGDYTHETWYPEYDYDLGDPTAPETKDSNGIHSRPFTNGLVLVNPTTSTHIVSFGGRYSGSGLTSATAATMPPRSALILTRDPVTDPLDTVPLTCTSVGKACKGRLSFRARQDGKLTRLGPGRIRLAAGPRALRIRLSRAERRRLAGARIIAARLSVGGSRRVRLAAGRSVLHIGLSRAERRRLAGARTIAARLT